MDPQGVLTQVRRPAPLQPALLLMALMLMAATARPGFGAAPGERLSIPLESTEQVVFDWNTDRCDPTDIPDESLRAFRDWQGVLRVFATNDMNRAMVGPDFAHLRHRCEVVYAGGQDDDPARFDDRQWMTSFATTDGWHVMALIHNEFHGHLRRALCRDGGYLQCWSNAITYATSDDGGATFREPAPPSNLVASPPYPYQGDIGHAVGYFQPSNIVAWNGYSYVIFLATPFGAQTHGFCVARSDNLADPGAWRAWDGAGFVTAFVNPYRDHAIDPGSHVCKTMGVGSLFEIGSLLRDESSGLFVMVTGIAHRNAKPNAKAGAYVATSSDLVHWSEPSLLVSEAQLGRNEPAGRYQYSFFSLIDRASGSRYFSTISIRPSLSLFYVKLDTRNAPYGRALVERDVAIERQGVPR